MRFFFGTIGLMLWVAAQAAEPTNSISPPATQSVSNCLRHIETGISQLEALAETATNNPGRAQCIADKLIKARSLSELVDGLSDSLETHQADADDESAAEDRTLILAACSRLDKLVEDAVACKSSAIAKARRTAPSPVTNAPRTVVNTSTVTPASVIRDATTCLKQAVFAEMLVGVLGLEHGRNADPPVQVLTKLGIQPLDGWAAEECLTVDDLCVAVARALHLPVEKTEDPYSYVQAVRNDGLPVDSVLPRRRRESTPAVLLETEVQLFLARGYAARFPSCRRIEPE